MLPLAVIPRLAGPCVTAVVDAHARDVIEAASIGLDRIARLVAIAGSIPSRR